MSNTRSTRETIELKIKEIEDEQGKPPRSERIKIGGGFKSLPVISLPLSAVKLNPRNHRLTAQIQDTGLGPKILENPYSFESQKLIINLLAETEQFKKLKDELKDLGQREPGLVMRDGLLINGNTRCAALKTLSDEGESFASNIDVAVLPESITEEDIPDIEMEHQMLKLTHQEYTFTNELLFMQSFRESGKSDKALAEAMNWKRRGQEKVRKHMRLLEYITEVRKIDPGIRYEVFDSKKTHLFDMDQEIQALINEGDERGARDLKYQRLLALLMGLNKDQVREVDLDFFQEIVEDTFERDGSLKSLFEKHEEAPSTFDEDFDDEEEDKLDINLDYQRLFESFLKEGKTSREDSEGAEVSDSGFEELVSVLDESSTRKINENRRETRRQELSLTMRSIRMSISDISEKLPERVKEDGFKAGEFKFEIKKAKDELHHLQKEFERFNKH
ncbi:MAG: hypothetical protein ACON4W_07045 [Parvibaculales bacterium]